MTTQSTNMDNKKTMNISVNELIRSIRLMIIGITDVHDRKTFTTSLADAIEAKDYKKIGSIFSVVSKYIHESDKVPKKRDVYDEPPTFLQAGMDFVHDLCNDLLNIPKLSEYYSGVERDAFPDTTNWNNGRIGKKSKTKRVPRTVDTFVKKDMILVKGDTQSGKEKFTVASSIKSLLEGRTPIIVTRRITCDADKVERGILNYSNMFNQYMDEHQVKQEFKISCIRANDHLADIKNFVPSMIVTLGNNTQLSKVLEFGKRFCFKFDLYIDEIDNVDYGDDSKASEILKELKKLSYQTIGITATPLDSILSEEELKSVNIMRLSRPEDYRGFVDIQVKLLLEDPEINAVNRKVTNYQDILDADKNFYPFLQKFSKTRPEFAWSIKKYIPGICLIKHSRINDSQETAFNGIINDFPRDFAVILYNGHGVKMKYPNMPVEVVYKGKTIKPCVNVDLDITNALQLLKENGGVKAFPRIIIIAGELAGRCIYYVSRDYDWPLTDMYYNPAKSTPIPEMIQSCGRLCGRNRGKSHLHLHCTKRVADALYDGFHFTNEIIERAIASPLLYEDEEISFSKSVTAIPMNNEKFPKGRAMTSKVNIKKKDFNLVKGDDKGYSLDTYKFSEGKEKVEENVTPITGYTIIKPNSGKSLEIYNEIVLYLTDKKSKWVPLVEIRKIFKSETRVQIHLHERTKEISDKGLMWRQVNGINSAIDYCLV